MIKLLTNLMISKQILSPLDKMMKIAKVQRRKYALKGCTNSTIAVLLLFFIFWVLWYAGKQLWPTTFDHSPSNLQARNSFVMWNSIYIHTAFQLVIFLLSLPGYLGYSKLYQSYQVNRRSKWPWQRQNWRQFRTKTILNLIFNQLVIYPIPCYLSTVIGIDLRFDGFPSYWEVFLQIHLIFFMEDFFFYCSHRLAHSFKPFYSLHKVHHQYDHLFSPASEYHHPCDYILFNILPSAYCFLILGSRVHVFTFLFWIIHKILFSGQNHCGYEVPWSPFRVIPLVASVQYHDNHHSLNVGNYAGSWYLWDVIFNTSGPYLDEFLGEDKQKR